MNKVLLPQPNEHANTLMSPFTPSIRNYTILGVLVWFFSALMAGWFGYFSQPEAPPRHLVLFIVPPLVVFTALYFASASFRAFTQSIPLPIIVGAHVWRYVGLGFIFAFLLGKLPPQFAIPEGAGDVVAALFSLPLAFALYRGRPVRRWFVAWNIFGLVDLVSAIAMGMLYSEGPLGILRTGISTALMTSFPVNLIPTFFVPLFILLHLLALARRGEAPSPSETGNAHFPVKRGSGVGGFAGAHLEEARKFERIDNLNRRENGFLPVLAAPARSQEIPETADVYGWLVGSWKLEVCYYWGTDVSTRRIKGEAHFGRVLEGRGVQDVWIMPQRRERTIDLDKSMNMYGTTLRVWDPSLQAWRITWINPVTGRRDELIGRRVGKGIVQIGTHSDGTPIRWSFTEITPDSFRWLGEALQPDGKTWKLEGEFRARRMP